MKFPFQQYNMIDIIANGLKPANDKVKIMFFLCKLVEDCFAGAKEFIEKTDLQI